MKMVPLFPPFSYRKPTLDDFEQYVPTLASAHGGHSYTALTQMRQMTTQSRNTDGYSVLQRTLLCLGLDRLAGRPKPRGTQPRAVVTNEPVVVTDDEAIDTVLNIETTV